jgi:glycerol-3-phosphate dehydrogenase
VGFPQTPAATTAWVQRNGTDLGDARARTLLARYGTNASAVIAHIVAAEESDTPLTTLPDYSTAEIDFLMGEHTVHLSDLVLRRSIIAFVGSLDQAVFDELSELAAASQRWSPERLHAEREQAAENLRFFHGIVVEAANTTAASVVN